MIPWLRATTTMSQHKVNGTALLAGTMACSVRCVYHLAQLHLRRRCAYCSVSHILTACDVYTFAALARSSHRGSPMFQ